jgi:hypothetical protein
MSNNEMFVKDPLDPDYGRISYEFLPTGVVPPAVPTLNAVLTAGNQALGVDIDAQGGDVLCNTLRCISLKPVAFPIVQEIGVEGSLTLDPFTRVGFTNDAKITCNTAVSEKVVLETENATTANPIFKIAQNNIRYETVSKLMTVNPVSIPPSPLIPGQGLTVVGDINASTGGISADNNITTNGDVVIKGTNPSVDFKNTSNVQKASLDYVQLTDKVTLTGQNVIMESLGAGAPRILLDSTGGNATMRADDIDVRLQRFNGTGTTLNTELALTGSGTVNIKAPVSAANPTLKLTNADTSMSASLDYDSFSVNLRAPEVPIYLQYLDGTGTNTNYLLVGANSVNVNISDGGGGSSVVEFGVGSIAIKSDFGVGAPILSLIDTGSSNGGSIDYGGNALNITNSAGPITLYAVDVNATATTGSVSIQTNNPDTSISMGVNSGTAGMSITDLGGFNNIEASAAGANLTVGNAIDPFHIPSIIMSANGNANQLKVTDNRTEIVGNTGSSAPLLKFVDSSTVVPPFEMTLVNDGVNSGVRMTYFDSSAVPATIVKFQDNGVYIIGDALGSGYIPQLHFKDIQYNTSAVLSLNGNNFQLNADVFTVASSNVRLASIPLATKSNILYYDSLTNIVSYGANVLPVFVTGPTSATAITLTAADNNKTYVFTSRPSAFQQFNAVGLPLGFSISVRNAAGPGDIDIRKDGGLSLGTLHPRTGAVNASTVPLEVNGTGLIGYF